MDVPGQEAITAEVKSRLRNPFLGSLALSVLAFHWKFFYALLAMFTQDCSAAECIAAATRYPHPEFALDWSPPMAASIGSALFFTFMWTWIDGWITTLRKRIALKAANRDLAYDSEQRFETAASMQKRTDYIELLHHVGFLMNTLRRFWGAEAARAGANYGDFGIIDINHTIADVFLPCLLTRDKDGKYRRAEGNHATNEDVIALEMAGGTRVLCTSRDGLIPWKWPGVTVMTLESGRFRPLQPGEQPSQARLEARGSGGYGVFVL